jgi:putative SOS response-associated peptidase YedK
VKGEPLFAMAGLYDTWIKPDGEKLHTCSIITTAANTAIADIHPRMPAIVPRDQIRSWLDLNTQEPEKLLALLEPYTEKEMIAYAVRSTVNAVKNDSRDCFSPMEA